MVSCEIPEFERILEEFSRCANKVRTCTEVTLRCVDEGCVPDQKSIFSFQNELGLLQKQYDEMYAMAEEMLTGGDLPAIGASVQTLKAAIINGKRQQAQRALEDAKKELERFVSVKALAVDLAEELRPYQERAQALLTAVSNDDICGLGGSEIFNGSKVFLNALQAEKAAKWLLIKEIRQYFPESIGLGLMGDMYYLDEEPDQAEEETELTDTPVSVDESAQNIVETAESALEQELPATISQKAADEFYTEQTELHPETDFVNAETADDVYTSCFAIKQDTPTAKNFRSDMIKKYPEEARMIFPLLTNLGMVTNEQIFAFGVVMNCFEDTDAIRDKVHHSLDKLAREKGVLAAFTVPGSEETAYCLTPYSHGCLQKDAIRSDRKLFYLSLGKHEVISAGTISRSVLEQELKNNALLLEHLQKERERLNVIEFKKVQSSIRYADGMYHVNTFQGSQMLPCVLNGAAPVGDALSELVQEEPEREEPVQEEPVQEESTQEEPVQETTSQETAENWELAEKYPADNAEEYAAQLCRKKKLNTEQLVHEAVLLMAEDRHAEAAALLDTVRKAPKAEPAQETLYAAYVMGADLPVSRPVWLNRTNNALVQLQSRIANETGELCGLQEAMLASAALQTLLFPDMAYDHDLYNTGSFYVGSEFEANYPEEYTVMRSIAEMLSHDLKESSFKVDGLGFSDLVISNLTNDNDRERHARFIWEKARELEQTPKSTVRITGLETCLQRMVGPTSLLGKALSSVRRNEVDKADDIRQFIMSTFCDDNATAYMVKQKKVEQYIDDMWDETRAKDKAVKLRHLNNDSPARNVCDKALKDRIEVVTKWLSISMETTDAVFSQCKEQFDSILDRLDTALTELEGIVSSPAEASIYVRAGKRVIAAGIAAIRKRFEGRTAQSAREFFKPLFCKPCILVDRDGTPVVFPELYHLRTMEPWMEVLRSVCTPQEPVEKILAGVVDFNNALWYRNYGREQLILGENVPDRTDDLKNAKAVAVKKTDEFKGKVRLARAYGKVQESLMETLFNILDRVFAFFCGEDGEKDSGVYDFARYQTFLTEMDDYLTAAISISAAELRKRIDVLKANPKYAEAEIFENIKQALNEGNFVRVESYMNRLESGERALPDSERVEDSEQDFLRMFLRGEDQYYKVCIGRSGDSFSNWAIRELQKMGRAHTHWTSNNEQGKAEKWVASWIRRKDTLETPGLLRSFLTMLGFNVERVSPKLAARPGAPYEVYSVSVVRTPSGLKDYRHPVYKYGTDLTKTMNVVCLFGCKGVSTLINVLTNDLQLNGPTIVMMDGSLSATDRKKVSAKFKSDTSGQSPFLLIDRVLMLFLASLDEGNRLCAMLKCTLPFTFETLYTNGTGPVPDEMFIGRALELRELTDHNGPSLVYGGRQLGKTALLNRASKILHDPEKKQYSFCCIEVKDCKSDALVREMNQNLRRLGLIDTVYDSVPELCNGLKELYDNGKYDRLTIFVDEVDELFNEYKQDDYKSLRPFVTLMEATQRHARIVFAGTHNVAATEAVMKKNNNLLHLGQPLCIEPLSTDDASRLIRRPMSYLGFDIGQQQMELIISNTNSYPGLIHMFCSSLVRSVCENFNDYYDEADRDMLPYKISDEQMKAVFQKRDIRKEIGIRVMATIELNKRYHVVASLLAYMIREQQESAGTYLYGFSAREIADYNTRELKIPMISALPETDMEALLDEMVRLGILWKNEETRQFRFKQSDFLEYIGDSDKVFNTLCEACGDGGDEA